MPILRFVFLQRQLMLARVDCPTERHRDGKAIPEVVNRLESKSPL
jgi:hypothetical protein